MEITTKFDTVKSGWTNKYILRGHRLYSIFDPGVARLIPAQSHTFTEIDHEIISTAFLLLLVQVGLLSVTSKSMCTKVLANCLVGLGRYGYHPIRQVSLYMQCHTMHIVIY